jgi:hypothetical protein
MVRLLCSALVTAGLLFVAVSERSSAANAPVRGAIFTTLSDGTAVNANHFASKCVVFLDGGPGPHAPAGAAGLDDGAYYFQVTDPSGKTLLSTDPVANRRFRVSGGFIVAYTGEGGPAHPVGVDRDHSELGAITIRLSNVSCPLDFLDSPNSGGAYKVWATPAGDFAGDPAQVDNPSGAGVYHGFVASKSKTDNFKVEDSPTFCLTVQVQYDPGNGIYGPGTNWQINVTDPQGVTNPFFTDATGQLLTCGLMPGTYTVDQVLPWGTEPSDLLVNGRSVPPDHIYSFTWTEKTPNPVIVFETWAVGVPM